MRTNIAVARTRVGFPDEIDQDAVCPCCGATGLRVFYELLNLPAQSCLVLRDPEEALAFPRADVRLGHCAECGFVTNVAFDPRLVEYDRRYEETQGYSPTFGAFARSLAERMVHQFDLKGKTVLEIGCGKGEFLTLLCELGAARGIGIDPTYVPERNTSPAADRVTVVPELYSEAHARFQADCICCRHTMEHISEVRVFLDTLRESLGDRRDVDILIEVPDAGRVLRQPAFLDIYNEHCSYFTAKSMTNAFELAGFEVTGAWLEYDDQYLMLTARPGSGRRRVIEPDPMVAEAVDRFADRCRPEIAKWRRVVAESAARGDRLVVWGSGSKSVAFLSTIGVTDEVAYVVDINPHRHGMSMPGVAARIESPAHVRSNPPDRVIVMNPVYVEEIRAMLKTLDVSPEVMAVE